MDTHLHGGLRRMRRAWIVLLFALLAILVPITAQAVPDQKNDAPGQSVATGNYIAQSFTPAEDGYLEGFDLKLQLTGSGYMSINVHIYEVNENGLPGNRIAYGAIQGLQPDNKVTVFAHYGGFSRSVYLTGGKQYALVIQGESDYQYAYNATDTYSGGTRFTYDGSNWSVAQGDLQFQTWQSRYIIYSAVPDRNGSAHWGRTNDSWNQRSELYRFYSNDGVTFTAADSPLLDESGTEGWVLKRVGYRFGGGWSTQPNQDVAEYESGSIYPMTHSLKLYPIWRANSGKPNRYTMPVGGSVDWGAVLSSNSNPDYFRQDGYKYTALKVGSSTISLYYQDGVDYTRIWHDIYVDIVPDLPTSHTMVSGDSVTFTSQTPGGYWNWSGPYFSRNGTTFTAINAGTTNISYTTNPFTGNAVTQTIAVTIITDLPDTYTMTTTQTANFAPQPADGEWGYDSEFFTLSGSVFTPRKTGTTTITYTVNGVTQSIAVTIKQGITGLPASVTLIDGASVSYSPQPAGGSWTYDDTFFDFVEATGTFTVKNAGTTTISYTTVEGVIQNIPVTVITKLPNSLTMIHGDSYNFAPTPSNGGWSMDGLYFNRSGSTFYAKLAGSTTVGYTVNGVTQHIDITVVTNLPDSYTLTEGDSIDFAPVPPTGAWGVDPAYFTRSGSEFTAIKAGTSAVTYTVNSVMQSVAVTIRQAITNLPESKTCIVGDVITFSPQPVGGNWTYDGAYFDRNGSTFTAKQEGTATIGYTTLEGVSKNVAVTVVTNLPGNYTLINGESIDFASVPSSGTWGFDSAYFTRSGSRFTAIKAGTSTITYTLNGVTQSISVSSVTDLPDSLTLIDGDSITLSPVPSGGTWGYDGAYLAQSGQEFTALRAGTTAVTYTLNGVTQNIAVTIITDLPETYALIRGESVDLAPVPADGAWGYNAVYFSRSGSTFTSILAGTSNITYTLNGVAQTISVWAKQPITGLPASSTVVEGETVTFAPQPLGGSWGFDAEYFDFSEGSKTFTAKKAGATDIVYTTAEGVSQTIPVTVVTNLPDEYTIIEGESVRFEPVPSNGTWDFDAGFVTRNGSAFTAIQTGKIAITYTVNGVMQSIAVTVAADLPDSITLIEGETFSFAPYPSTGTWAYDAAHVTRDGSAFTAVQKGTTL